MTINLSEMSDAELGRLVRASLTAARSDTIQVMTGDKHEIVAHLDENDRVLYAKAKADRRHLLLKGFSIGKQSVPILDVRDKVLDELVPASVRSIYNKARWALGERVLLDADKATWRHLVVEHVRLDVAATERKRVSAGR